MGVLSRHTDLCRLHVWRRPSPSGRDLCAVLLYRVLSVVVFLVFIHKNHADIEITDAYGVAAHSLR